VSRPGGEVLPRDFFDRPVLEVAPDLLGCVVSHRTPEGMVAVRLTEVEAYDGERDPGSHAFRGRTPRNAVMFGAPGHVYVYFTYGMHWCMNLVCGPAGKAAAVLLRAGEIVAGSELARSRRPTAGTERDLARGPARLTRALGVTGALDGTDVCANRGALQVCADPMGEGRPPDRLVRTGPRTGVGGEGARFPWRFWVDGEASVSAYRPAVVRRRRDKGAAEASRGERSRRTGRSVS